MIFIIDLVTTKELDSDGRIYHGTAERVSELLVVLAVMPLEVRDGFAAAKNDECYGSECQNSGGGALGLQE